jgi:anti-sigma factor RsiW
VRCDFADSLLQGYFDGELSDRTAAEFERHLRHCVHCATELVDLDLLRDSLQLAQLHEPATASLRRKIDAPLHALAPTTAAWRPRLRHWLAAAAAILFVAILLGRVGHAPRDDDYQAELAGEIVDAHLRSLSSGPLTGIASNTESDVKGWLDGRAGFAVPVRDFAHEGFALKGGRVDVVEGRAVAVLVYERNGRPINVFIWRTREADTSPRTGSRQGFQWVDWRKGKMEFCAVSDANPVDLEQLHQLMNSSAQTSRDHY